MRYQAESFTYSAGTDHITDAVVVPGRISVDWRDEAGKIGHLELTSDDESHYRGTYGYQAQDGKIACDSFRQCEFLRYNSNRDEIVLLGRWRNTQSGNQGEWMLRMNPKSGSSN